MGWCSPKSSSMCGGENVNPPANNEGGNGYRPDLGREGKGGNKNLLKRRSPDV